MRYRLDMLRESNISYIILKKPSDINLFDGFFILSLCINRITSYLIMGVLGKIVVGEMQIISGKTIIILM